MRRLRDLIIEHNARFDWGELYDDGNVFITKAEEYDDGYFEDAFTPYRNGVRIGDPNILAEHPITWPAYDVEVEVPVEGGENDTEWFTITFDKTFIRTRKTDAQLLKLIPVWEAMRRLVPNLND